MANLGASNLIFINGTSGVDTFSGSSVADIFQPYAEADTFIGNGGAGEFRLINTSSAE